MELNTFNLIGHSIVLPNTSLAFLPKMKIISDVEHDQYLKLLHHNPYPVM